MLFLRTSVPFTNRCNEFTLNVAILKLSVIDDLIWSDETGDTMLTYSFSEEPGTCLYRHLAACIKNDIISGNITAGSRLPSKRAFAKNLGISTITVENAYAELLDEGYILSVEKKGYFAAAVNPVVYDHCAERRLLAPAPDAGSASCSSRYDFTATAMLPELFPFATWAKLTRSVLNSDAEALMHQSPAAGTIELRQAIAAHLHDFRGFTVSPEQIVIGAGTEYLYGLIIQLIGFSAVYAVEDPGYRKITDIYHSFGVRNCAVPLDDRGISVDGLRRCGASVVHVSPSHHYPTGTVMPVSRRYELLGWASEDMHRVIIEDEYDAEFRSGCRPLPTLAGIDAAGTVIYMNTFSKTLASTVRISYMVLPRHLQQVFLKKLGFYSCTVPTFNQYTLAEFIQRGFFENHINRLRRYYREQRSAVLAAISSNPFLAGSEIREENSGLHFLLKVKTHADDQSLKAAAAARGVTIACLSDFYRDSAQAEPHVILISYAGIPRSSISAAVSLLGQCISTAV
jgi:GntR family transcriptional regulator / MocR family aminotransferase